MLFNMYDQMYNLYNLLYLFVLGNDYWMLHSLQVWWLVYYLCLHVQSSTKEK